MRSRGSLGRSRRLWRARLERGRGQTEPTRRQRSPRGAVRNGWPCNARRGHERARARSLDQRRPCYSTCPKDGLRLEEAHDRDLSVTHPLSGHAAFPADPDGGSVSADVFPSSTAAALFPVLSSPPAPLLFVPLLLFRQNDDLVPAASARFPLSICASTLLLPASQASCLDGACPCGGRGPVRSLAMSATTLFIVPSS